MCLAKCWGYNNDQKSYPHNTGGKTDYIQINILSVADKCSEVGEKDSKWIEWLGKRATILEKMILKVLSDDVTFRWKCEGYKGRSYMDVLK